MYLQSNQPYSRQTEDNSSFNWGKAGSVFATGAAMNFMQDVALNHASRYGAKSNIKAIQKPSQLMQDLMYTSEKGTKLSDNKGLQQMASWASKEKGANFIKNNRLLQMIPNAVPSTTSGKVWGYGLIPLAGAVFAGMTGESATEKTTKTAEKVLLGKEVD